MTRIAVVRNSSLDISEPKMISPPTTEMAVATDSNPTNVGTETCRLERRMVETERRDVAGSEVERRGRFRGRHDHRATFTRIATQPGSRPLARTAFRVAACKRFGFPSLCRRGPQSKVLDFAPQRKTVVSTRFRTASGATGAEVAIAWVASGGQLNRSPFWPVATPDVLDRCRPPAKRSPSERRRATECGLDRPVSFRPFSFRLGPLLLGSPQSTFPLAWNTIRSVRLPLRSASASPTFLHSSPSRHRMQKSPRQDCLAENVV